MKREKIYSTEAELCADFIEWASRHGYTAYAETAGWDILLVDKAGHQVGVEAKLRLNWKVVSQAMPSIYGADEGPDHRAVLVPELVGGACEVLDAVGIGIFYGGRRSWRVRPHFDRWNAWQNALLDWNPKRRHTLPEFVPDVVAGASAPVQLTPWKIGALKVLANIELRGGVTRAEITGYGIDPRRWTGPAGWLQPHPTERGSFIRGDCPGFDAQHPDVYAKIRAQLAEVMA